MPAEKRFLLRQAMQCQLESFDLTALILVETWTLTLEASGEALDQNLTLFFLAVRSLLLQFLLAFAQRLEEIARTAVEVSGKTVEAYQEVIEIDIE
jgi:hypothetical protein